MQMLYEQTLIVKQTRYLPKFRKKQFGQREVMSMRNKTSFCCLDDNQKKTHFTAIRKLMYYEFITTLNGE